MSPGRGQLAIVAVVALVFGTAPTVGDIGSCGTTATALDVGTFLAEKKALDCERCQSCGIDSQACTIACDAHALQAASCQDYASFMSDDAPTQPTECQFCLDVPDASHSLGDL